MARVTVEASQRHVRASRGVRQFRFEEGKIYHVLFLGEQVGEQDDGTPIWEPILYMNPTHNVRKDGRGFEARCANQKHNISDVVKVDENGRVALDPITGNPINDGTCPYCELHELWNKITRRKMQEWEDANPGASDKEKKQANEKFRDEIPVRYHVQTRFALAAVFEQTESGKVATDSDGNKIYTIQAIKFSDSRFNDKLMPQVEIKRRSLEDDYDKGIAWHEYYLSFPNKGNKMLSGKDMSISLVPNTVLSADPNLKEQLIKDISELDLDALEDKIGVYALRSLDEMNRDIAPMKSLVREQMTEQEILEARELLGEDVTVSDEEIANIMSPSQPAQVQQQHTQQQVPQDTQVTQTMQTEQPAAQAQTQAQQQSPAQATGVDAFTQESSEDKVNSLL